MGLTASSVFSIPSVLAAVATDPTLSVLNSPVARILLLSIFLFSFYVAVHTPGHGLGEVVATVTLAVLLGAPLIAGTSTAWPALAVLLGLALLAAEVFLLPGFGVAGVSGLILTLGGLTLCFASRDSSALLTVTSASLQHALIVIVSGMAGSLVLWGWLGRYLPRLPYFNRLILPNPATTSPPPPPALPYPAVGTTGLTVTDLRPAGRVRFSPDQSDHVTTEVVSDAGFIPTNTPVTVTAVLPDRVLVRPAV